MTTKRGMPALLALLAGVLAAALPVAHSETAAPSPTYAIETLVGPNPIMKSTGMVVYHDDDEHFLYSADTLRNTIFRVNLDPGCVERCVDRIAHDFEPPAQQLISPHTLELDESGRLYVTEYGTQTVRRLSRDGTGPRVLIAAGTGRTAFRDEADPSSGVMTGTSGIAFNSQGRLFVGDNIHDRQFPGGLWEVDPNGVVPPRQILSGLGLVEEITFDPRKPDLAYVTDVYGGAINVVDVSPLGSGAIRHKLTGFDKPWGLEYDTFGDRDRLLVVAMSGDLIEVKPNGDRSLLAHVDRPGLSSIAIDPKDGTVYVSNGVYGGLYRLDEKASRLVPVLAEGDFAIPTSLNEAPDGAMLPSGTLWVGDHTAISTVTRSGKVDRVLNFQADDYEDPNPEDPHWFTPSALQVDRTTVYFSEIGFFRDRITHLNLETGVRRFVTAPGALSTPYHVRKLEFDDAQTPGPDVDLLVTAMTQDPFGELVRVRLGKLDPATGFHPVEVVAENLETPGGVRYDPSTGLAYVSEVATGRIWEVEVETRRRTVVAEGFDAPEGLDLDDRGGLVVVEGEGARRLVRVDLASGAQEEIARDLPTMLRGPIPKPINFDLLADVLVREHGEIVVTAPADASIRTFRPKCTPAERREFLRQEQTRILNLVGDLRELQDADDVARLGAVDPESGTAYNFYDHMFVSFKEIGMAVVNTGELGVGKPDVLLYAPDPGASDVVDPYGPDFSYRLVGWAYAKAYDPVHHPTLLGPCIGRSDWFVHERSIHPADDWTNVAVPPEEDYHGEVPANEPPLPSDCQPAPCPAGVGHGRLWDIHMWLGDDGVASVSMLSPEPIPGADPGVGVSFFYPER